MYDPPGRASATRIVAGSGGADVESKTRRPENDTPARNVSDSPMTSSPCTSTSATANTPLGLAPGPPPDPEVLKPKEPPAPPPPPRPGPGAGSPPSRAVIV